jgi:hypothetical protein
LVNITTRKWKKLLQELRRSISHIEIIIIKDLNLNNKGNSVIDAVGLGLNS